MVVFSVCCQFLIRVENSPVETMCGLTSIVGSAYNSLIEDAK